MSFEISFQNLLGWEGGFTDNTHDAGGATNLGVTQSEYDAYRDKRNLPRQSVAHISIAEAEEIYRAEYWAVCKCAQLNAGLANCLFDGAVNSGTRRAGTWLQEAINQVSGRDVVTVDGIVGPKTIAAANALSPDKLIDAILALRLAFLKTAKNSKTGELLWPTFGNGWTSRVNGVRFQSHALTLPVQQQKETIHMGILANIGTWMFSLLSGDQIQSLLRTALKVAGTALIAKAGGDTGSIDTIVGGIVAAIGVVGSIVTHGPDTTSTPAASA